ncbi:MAG TPA: ABC transporter ATP-binding protein [Candidatus Dormibacteraeota bacterium]|jgi:branched-chain amino acid transport system ATP-binding protein|nr:ABC transporter ATP-binding protein [Candidatus Dormibacteraeota bacterium]
MTADTTAAAEPARAPSGTPVLELRDVDVLYGRVQALRGVSLTVGEGEIVALIGSNGAGKTTTLRTISGLVRPSKGEVLLRGEPIQQLGSEKIAQLGVGHAPEGRRLFSRMTVRENLDMGAYSRRDRAGIRSDFDRVYELFPRVKERSSQLAGSLSGGEQQMVAIGRALMARPSVLLLDEPSLGLAPIVVDSLFAVIREINQGGTTVLLIEQNALLALNTARRGYVLEVGEVATQGPSEELLHSPEVQRAYLGM